MFMHLFSRTSNVRAFAAGAPCSCGCTRWWTPRGRRRCWPSMSQRSHPGKFLSESATKFTSQFGLASNIKTQVISIFRAPCCSACTRWLTPRGRRRCRASTSQRYFSFSICNDFFQFFNQYLQRIFRSISATHFSISACNKTATNCVSLVILAFLWYFSFPDFEIRWLSAD